MGGRPLKSYKKKEKTKGRAMKEASREYKSEGAGWAGGKWKLHMCGKLLTFWQFIKIGGESGKES